MFKHLTKLTGIDKILACKSKGLSGETLNHLIRQITVPYYLTFIHDAKIGVKFEGSLSKTKNENKKCS